MAQIGVAFVATNILNRAGSGTNPKSARGGVNGIAMAASATTTVVTSSASEGRVRNALPCVRTDQPCTWLESAQQLRAHRRNAD